ncbi:MAG: lipoyl domain-containing protein [Pseudomonadota bacterium]
MADITMNDYADDLEGEEASVVTWYFSDGDTVAEGSVLCDVAVAKTQFEIVSKAAGKLTILVQPEIPITESTVIGRIDPA